MLKVFILCTPVLFAVAGYAQTPGGAPAPKAPKPAASAPASGVTWTPSLQETFGIDADDFHMFGMDKLSKDQLAALLLWMRNRQAAEKASVPELPYSCGRETGGQPDAYGKVRILFLDGGVPGVLTNGIYERLRNMDDVELVYAQKDADLIVDVLGYENSSVGGSKTGYTLSLTTMLPCRWRVGTQDFAILEFHSHHVQTSPSAAAAVGTAVSTLNANDLDEVRKRNAVTKQSLEQKPAPESGRNP